MKYIPTKNPFTFCANTEVKGNMIRHHAKSFEQGMFVRSIPIHRTKIPLLFLVVVFFVIGGCQYGTGYKEKQKREAEKKKCSQQKRIV